MRGLDLEGMTKRMMCISNWGMGSPLSMMVRMRFMVSTLLSSVPFSSCVRSSDMVGVPSVALSLTRLHEFSRNDMTGG